MVLEFDHHFEREHLDRVDRRSRQRNYLNVLGGKNTLIKKGPLDFRIFPVFNPTNSKIQK